MRENHEVCILGNNRILNELLSAAIEKELGFACFSCSRRSEVPPLTGLFEVWELPPTILLVDDADEGARSRTDALQGNAASSSVAVAFFNVVRPHPGLYDAIRRGLRGVFFATDALESLLEGIRMIAGGGVCIPHEVVAGATSESMRSTRTALERAGLTGREVEILSHVASGATNEQIASSLFVSPHTVKTHIYNVYRKIGVTNRLRATLWAAENLAWRPGLPAREDQPAAAV